MSRIDRLVGILIIICCMFPVCVLAEEPVITISLSPEKVWIVANGADNDLITVTVFNGTIPMNGSIVTFNVDNPTLGYFNPASPSVAGYSAPLVTVNGSASVLFRSKTTSGNATISATIRYKMNDTAPEESKTVQIVQQIDHDTPYKISNYNLTSEGTVGTVSPIFIWVQDSHNNPVDNKREVSESRTPESVVFSITGQPEPSQPPPATYNPANFAPEGANTVTRYVNQSGMVNGKSSFIVNTRVP